MREMMQSESPGPVAIRRGIPEHMRMLSVLDRFGTFGRPIRFTEFDMELAKLAK